MRATNLARREETGAGRAKAEQFQVELDRLGATLRQVEEYNERVKGEIAVTRRATYAAEEAISKMEKEKKEQDLLIDQLQVGGLPGWGCRVLWFMWADDFVCSTWAIPRTCSKSSCGGGGQGGQAHGDLVWVLCTGVVWRGLVMSCG
jgi:hypothetical protein